MKFVALGDRQASAIGLGFWQFGAREWAWGADFGEAAAKPIVEQALELGINLFDTAEIYGNGRSEQILGAVLGSRRDDALIASKVSPAHATRAGVVSAAEQSLRRLGTDRIDLYQLHWPARLVPISRTMAGMRDLQDSGRVRQVGVSNFSLAAWLRADKALGAPVIANQAHFNLIEQAPLAGLVPLARREGRVVIAYSPLAQGVLGGRYDAANRPADFRAAHPGFSRANLEAVRPLLEELRAVAQSHGATPAQIALAWLVHLPNVIAIPGARSVEQVEANAAAADIELSPEEWERLRELGAAVRLQLPLQRRIRRAVSTLLRL